MVLVAMWHASEKQRDYLVIFLIVGYVDGGSSSGAMARMSTNFNGRHRERLRYYVFRRKNGSGHTPMTGKPSLYGYHSVIRAFGVPEHGPSFLSPTKPSV